eukprot:1339097-Amphidinium_carterae.1
MECSTVDLMHVFSHAASVRHVIHCAFRSQAKCLSTHRASLFAGGVRGDVAVIRLGVPKLWIVGLFMIMT